MFENNRGQIGFNFLVGIITAVICIVVFSALMPTIIESFGISKGSNSANCIGYTDPDATTAVNYSYNSTIDTDTLSCQVLGFGPGLIVVAVVFGIVAGIISGRIGQGAMQQQPQYEQYQQQY